ncbi:MAG: relaxase domain-containing protein, partial [Lentisphaeria bacterium]|nr:relaxase domain-containing protein [Lentisphaeria bacterium]
MFTCARIKATKGKGADFYRQHLSCNDYFSEHEAVKGVWLGSLAEDFDLSGKPVDPSVFSAFQQNIDPVSGKKLTVRNVENAVRFYDFQCSAQKSVSIMSLFDDRLEKAHQRAVRLAMKEMERFASVRLRSGINANTDNIEFTGNFIYAEYHHDSSRLLDPQLHTHNVIVNVTRDSSGRYKALQSREMVRAIRYASKVYLNKLAEECGLLGYDLEKKYRDKGELVGFEIKGVSEEILKRCSRRREQIDQAIERFAETHGRQPTIDEVGQLTLLTRSRKMLTRTNVQVKSYKLALFSDEEKAQLKKLFFRAFDRGAMFAPWLSDEDRMTAVRKVAVQLFERESVITEDKLLAEVLNQNLGKLNLEELKKDVAMLPELVNLEEPSANPYLTTREHMNHEAEILKLASLMKEFETPLKSSYVPFSESEDTFDHSAQKAVIEDILGSKNKFQIFRGVAGAGKTSTLQELCKCLKYAGVGNIHLVAPTNSAVDVLQSEGFGSAQTVAKFLLNPRQLPPDGSYLIVDESGLNSVRQGHEMMQLALQHDYRILFVGDERQHSSVEAGDFFRLLENYSEIDKTELAEIHRQQDEEYRRGILMASEGDVGGAFDQLDSHGFIHENQGRYLDAAAESFLRLTEDGKRPLDCIAVSPTNRECELLTEKIREKMKSKGVLDAGSERQVEAFRSWDWTAEKIADVEHYRPGMRVFLTSKIKEIGNAGEMFEVKAIEGKKLLLSNGQYLNPHQFKDRLDVGEMRELAIAKGDVVRLTVNIKTPDFKINNGSLAIATGNPNEFILLDHNRKELQTVRLPESFHGLKYGWVITSHSSQGMTSKNVVVAAEKMSGQAFYVACSRGRKNLSLHVPEKEFFKDRLVKIPTERKLVTDISGGIPPWKAPALPPPPAELIGSRLRQFMDRTIEQMRKAQKVVAGYIERAMYHVFNHNIRKKDHERKEQIR